LHERPACQARYTTRSIQAKGIRSSPWCLVRRGQREATLEGFSTGGRTPYGYRRVEVPDPRGRTDRTGQPIRRVTLAIDPAEVAIVRRIFEMEWGTLEWGTLFLRLTC
jgi:hypothetical protein